MDHTTAVILKGPVKHSSLAIIIQSYYLFLYFPNIIYIYNVSSHMYFKLST